MGGGSYTVQGGDNWFDIAEQIYGNSRMASQLMEANGGVSMLRPGQTINLPRVSEAEAEKPFFSQRTWDNVEVHEAARVAQQGGHAKPASGGEEPPPTPDFPTGATGLEMALRQLGQGSLTPLDFAKAFPHVDLANAILISRQKSIEAISVESLWREGVVSEAAYERKQQDERGILDGLQSLAKGEISEADLLEQYPHLPIDQAMEHLSDPDKIYNLWMATMNDKLRAIEAGWDASADRYQEMADFYENLSEEDRSTANQIRDLLGFGDDFYDAAKMSSIQFSDLEGSYFSVSTPNVRVGQRLDARLAQDIPGTRYALNNMPVVTGRSLLKNWRAGLGIDAMLSLGFNTYDYGWGENANVGIASEEFAVSTGVDFVASAVIGLASAGIVAGAIALLGISAPLVAAGLATAVIATAISSATQGIIEGLKTTILDRLGN